jgi:hypothetical protein
MEPLQVADGGGSFQIWRLAGNMLKEQMQTSDKEWSFWLELANNASQQEEN